MQIKMFHVWIMGSLLVLVLLGCNLQVQKTGRGGDPEASPSPSIKCWCGEDWDRKRNFEQSILEQKIFEFVFSSCRRSPFDTEIEKIASVEYSVDKDGNSCRVYNGRCAGMCWFEKTVKVTCFNPPDHSAEYGTGSHSCDCVKKKEDNG